MTFLGFRAVMGDRDRPDRLVWLDRDEIVAVVGGPADETVDVLTSIGVIYTVRQQRTRTVIFFVLTGESGTEYFSAGESEHVQ